MYDLKAIKKALKLLKQDDYKLIKVVLFSHVVLHYLL